MNTFVCTTSYDTLGMISNVSNGWMVWEWFCRSVSYGYPVSVIALNVCPALNKPMPVYSPKNGQSLQVSWKKELGFIFQGLDS